MNTRTPFVTAIVISIALLAPVALSPQSLAVHVSGGDTLLTAGVNSLALSSTLEYGEPRAEPNRLKGALWGAGIGGVAGGLLGGLSAGSDDDSLIEAAATGASVVVGAFVGAAFGAVLGATVFAPDRRMTVFGAGPHLRAPSGFRRTSISAGGRLEFGVRFHP